MFRRVVLDDDEWLITTGLFGGMWVYLKPYGRTCKVYSGERRHLEDIIQELRKVGSSVDPHNAAFAHILKQFARSVMLRGDTTWRNFFVHASARQIADAALGRRTATAIETDDLFAVAHPSPSAS